MRNHYLDPEIDPATYLDPYDGRVNSDGPMLVRARLNPSQTVTCCLCGHMKSKVYADVNGRPFEDFYCDDCVAEFNI